MTPRLLLHCCYALLLLIAQQTALTHAAWHAHTSEPEQYEEQSQGSLHVDFCQFHGALAQVLGAVDAAVPRFVAGSTAPVPAAARGEGRCTFALLTPPARGPPHLS